MASRKNKSLKNNKNGNSRRWHRFNRWQQFTGIFVVVLIVASIGFHFLGKSHADTEAFFYASRTNNIHYCAGQTDPCEGFDTLSAPRLHYVICQKQVSDQTATYGSAVNNWWIKMEYKNYQTASGSWYHGWVNAVFASGGNNYQPVPGIPIC